MERTARIERSQCQFPRIVEIVNGNSQAGKAGVEIDFRIAIDSGRE
jgi:Flp pilus assembly protein TadB